MGPFEAVSCAFRQIFRMGGEPPSLREKDEKHPRQVTSNFIVCALFRDFVGQAIHLNQGRIIMTTSPADGLPPIDRPRSTWAERVAFYLQRNWMWTTIVACVLTLAVTVGAFALIADILEQDFLPRKLLAWFLVALAFAQLAFFACSFIESGVARPWMIRAALASATNAERALLHHGLAELSQSKWRDSPLSRGELFRLFNEARQSVGDDARQKLERLMAIHEAQIEELRVLADCQKDNS